MLIRDLKGTFRYLKTHGKTVGIITLVFFVACMGGYVALYDEPRFAQYMASVVKQMSSSVGDAEGFELFKLILFNNVKACTLAVLYGVIPFLFIPALSICLNGAISGAVVAWSVQATGQSALEIVARGILPHGIFEIPALIIAASLGAIMCKEMSKKFTSKSSKPMIDVLNETARCFMIMVIPLLIVAALVESFITPAIIG